MSVLCKLVLRFEHPINCKVSPQDEVSSKGVLSIHVVSLGRLQAGKAGTGSSPCRILGGSYNVSVCVCVVSVIVKRPVLPPCVADGRSHTHTRTHARTHARTHTQAKTKSTFVKALVGESSSS